MLFLYGLGNSIGYFAVMLVILLIAVFCKTKKAGWIFYGIAAIVQLKPLISAQLKYDSMGLGHLMNTKWLVYIVLLIIAATILFFRWRKPKV